MGADGFHFAETLPDGSRRHVVIGPGARYEEWIEPLPGTPERKGNLRVTKVDHRTKTITVTGE